MMSAPECIPSAGSMTSTSTSETITECPLCLEELTVSDRIYALHCPTPTCQFNYCYECIRRLCKSAGEGYSTASDGSNQVKISVSCPQCRAKYKCARFTSETAVAESVLMLRRAHRLSQTSLVAASDSELPASSLQEKNHFVRTVTIESLSDAFRRLQIYMSEIGTSEYDKIVPELNWRILAPALSSSSSQQQQRPQRRSRQSSAATEIARNGSFETDADGKTIVQQNDDGVDVAVAIDIVGAGNYVDDVDINHNEGGFDASPPSSFQPAAPRPDFVDATLFLGLDDFMTFDERVFVTQLFTCGKPDLVAQASQILSEVLTVGTTRGGGGRGGTATSGGGGSNPRKTTTNNQKTHCQGKNPAATALLKDPMKLRQRYPLPPRMPRCVTLESFDPADPNLRNRVLTFQNPTTATTTTTGGGGRADLVLSSVRGPAGRLGLRRGDVVTHVQGEEVRDHDEYAAAVNAATATACASSTTSTSTSKSTGVVTIVVNADETTSSLLQGRAEKMKRELLLP